MTKHDTEEYNGILSNFPSKLSRDDHEIVDLKNYIAQGYSFVIVIVVTLKTK